VIVIVIFQIIVIIGLILYLNYPFVLYKTEEKALSKFVELYGDYVEKSITETNGIREIRYAFKKDETTYTINVKKHLFGYKIDYISIHSKNERTFKSGLYTSHTVYFDE